MLDLRASKVRWDRENYVPRKVSGFKGPAESGTPRQIAVRFLKENSQNLKIADTIKDLKYEKTTESLGSRAALFQQHFKGIPIHGAWVSVHVNNARRVFLVKNDTIPVSVLERRLGRKRKAITLAAAEIDRIARRHAREHGSLSTPIKREKMIYALKGAIRKVWKVQFGTRKPASSWILFIDARTGAIIEERDVLRKATGKGRVFIPNPVVALNRDDLHDFGDAAKAVLVPAYRTVDLEGLKPGGFLSGAHVDTSNTPARARVPTLQFLFGREDDRFEEVMIYYHIDRVQRYIQSLGFTGTRGVLNRPIQVNAHGGPDDQSFYDPSPGARDLTFGDGGVDDAEDAEVILHEYGHAIQDAIIPGFGQINEGKAMGEGFGDYLAASFFARYKTKARRVKVAEWDAKGYGPPPEECLRRLDSSKLYPQDMEREEHADGEIWSACLWKVRGLLGARKADSVILESHFYLSPYADFKDGAEAVIMAEQNLYGGRRTKSLTRIFRERGILQ